MDQTLRHSAAPAEMSDEALVHAIAKGDRLAFRRLMERHGPTLLRAAQRILGSPGEADDIVQEVFLKVWVRPHMWRPDGSAQFGTWIYRVMLNQCIDRKRKRSHAALEDAGDPADEGPNAEDALARSGVKTILEQALGRLPERQALALRTYYYGEIKTQEAAAVMGLSLSAFEALMFRARRALKHALAELGIQDQGDCWDDR